MSVGYIICDNNLSVFLNDQIYNLDSSHPNYKLVIKELEGKQRKSVLKKLVSIKKSVETFMKGRIRVLTDQNQVFYKNELVEPIITKRIIDFMKNGLDAKPLLKFLDKLMSNPSNRSIQELYKFLENQNMPITTTGNFIAFKGVSDDYYDKQTHSILNKPNKIIQMPRSKVDDNCNNTCSSGLHGASLEFAKSFGERVMILEIDPSNTVSVPVDHNAQKLRMCKYKVIAEFDHNKHADLLNQPVVEVKQLTKKC